MCERIGGFVGVCEKNVIVTHASIYATVSFCMCSWEVDKSYECPMVVYDTEMWQDG